MNSPNTLLGFKLGYPYTFFNWPNILLSVHFLISWILWRVYIHQNLWSSVFVKVTIIIGVIELLIYNLLSLKWYAKKGLEKYWVNLRWNHSQLDYLGWMPSLDVARLSDYICIVPHLQTDISESYYKTKCIIVIPLKWQRNKCE